MFDLTMRMAEVWIHAARAAEKEYPSKKKNIRRLATFYAQAVAAGGDMTDEMAEELLDDLSTDGKQIFSDKISSLGSKILFLIRHYGIDILPHIFYALHDTYTR